MKTTFEITKQLNLFGEVTEDFNLDRTVKEFICHTEHYDSKYMAILYDTVELNPKYKPELDDIEKWYEEHFPLYSRPEFRRRVVYFNDLDYENRFQCISLFQVVDDTLIIYQRSGDTLKMLDDLRFFAEIRHRYFQHVRDVNIVYGSVHTKINNDVNSNDC